MWPFSRPHHDPEPVNVMYRGAFQYAGQAPTYDRPSSIWRVSEAVVTTDGVVYREKVKGAWRNRFTIPDRSIRRVDHITVITGTTKRLGFLTTIPVDTVTIEIDDSGRRSTVGFSTEYEDTAIELYGALNVMVGRRPGPLSDPPLGGYPAWLVRDEDPEPADVIFKGSLLYAGGHPEYGAPGLSRRRARVYVAAGGVTYQERVKGGWQSRFTIPVTAIQSVDRTTMARGAYREPGLLLRYSVEFITIEMEYEGRSFVVRFKAPDERLGSAFSGALSAMLARQPAA